MNDHYENLDEVDLFEERHTASFHAGNSAYLYSRVEQVDDLFEGADVSPTVYPAEETLQALQTDGEIPEGEDIVLALTGDFARYVGELDDEDFESYHGEYVVPKDADNVVIRIGQEEVDAEPVDIDVDNIDFRIPDVPLHVHGPRDSVQDVINSDDLDTHIGYPVDLTDF